MMSNTGITRWFAMAPMALALALVTPAAGESAPPIQLTGRVDIGVEILPPRHDAKPVKYSERRRFGSSAPGDTPENGTRGQAGPTGVIVMEQTTDHLTTGVQSLNQSPVICQHLCVLIDT